MIISYPNLTHQVNSKGAEYKIYETNAYGYHYPKGLFPPPQEQFRHEKLLPQTHDYSEG